MAATLSRDPIHQFRRWYQDAERHRQIDLPEAMCLSTVTARGFPTARMVLLKDVTPAGFTFFTNRLSPKGQDLDRRARAALTFHWRPLHRQVRIEGRTVRLDKHEADTYFASRPRLSQIGAWASQQSQPIASRKVLLDRFKFFRKKFLGREVPAPPYWHGYRVIPERIEFWREGPNRLHDRWLYTKRKNRPWTVRRLAP